MKQYIVVCTDFTEKPGQRDAEEFIENIWVSIDSLKAMVQNGELENVNLLAGLYMWECMKDQT